MFCSRPITLEEVVWGRCSDACSWCDYIHRWWMSERDHRQGPYR